MHFIPEFIRLIVKNKFKLKGSAFALCFFSLFSISLSVCVFCSLNHFSANKHSQVLLGFQNDQLHPYLDIKIIVMDMVRCPKPVLLVFLLFSLLPFIFDWFYIFLESSMFRNALQSSSSKWRRKIARLKWLISFISNTFSAQEQNKNVAFRVVRFD